MIERLAQSMTYIKAIFRKFVGDKGTHWKLPFSLFFGILYAENYGYLRWVLV